MPGAKQEEESERGKPQPQEPKIEAQPESKQTREATTFAAEVNIGSLGLGSRER